MTLADNKLAGRQVNVASPSAGKRSVLTRQVRSGGLIGRTVLIGVASPPILGVVAAIVLLVERVQRFFLATSRPLRKLKGAAQSGLFSLFAET